MLQKIIIVLLVAITTKLSQANAVTIEYVPVKTIPSIIRQQAFKYSVSEKLMTDIIMCESSMNPNAVGDNGHSRGLVQIYDSFHPNVTHEQAFNEEFAVEFLAKNLSLGKGKMWSCFSKVKRV